MEKGWVIPQVEKQDNHIQKNDTGSGGGYDHDDS